MTDPSTWIRDLGLVPHPEGGFYRETQRSRRCTTIVYLLPAGEFSAWHRLRGADEVWHFYAGAPLSLWLLDDAGPREIVLGAGGGFNVQGPTIVALDISGTEVSDNQAPSAGGVFHGVVPAETWQAARPRDGGYALVGCTVAPAFEFDRFEMAGPELIDRWPEHREQGAALLRR